MDAIFMVGEQRSGSNLLRVMLGQAAEIAAPHPPHILQRMMPLSPLYGDLQDESTFRMLVDDVCQLVEHNPVPWENIATFNRDDVARRCRAHSLVAVFGADDGHLRRSQWENQMALQKHDEYQICQRTRRLLWRAQIYLPLP